MMIGKSCFCRIHAVTTKPSMSGSPRSKITASGVRTWIWLKASAPGPPLSRHSRSYAAQGRRRSAFPRRLRLLASESGSLDEGCLLWGPTRVNCERHGKLDERAAAAALLNHDAPAMRAHDGTTDGQP